MYCIHFIAYVMYMLVYSIEKGHNYEAYTYTRIPCNMTSASNSSLDISEVISSLPNI